MNNSRFYIDAILYHDENWEIELKSTISKIDVLLYNDEYWDVELYYDDDDTSYLNIITNTPTYENVNLCHYYGLIFLYQWDMIYFQDLACCTFENLAGFGEIDTECTTQTCLSYNIPLIQLTNVRINDLANCRFIDL